MTSLHVHFDTGQHRGGPFGPVLEWCLWSLVIISKNFYFLWPIFSHLHLQETAKRDCIYLFFSLCSLFFAPSTSARWESRLGPPIQSNHGSPVGPCSTGKCSGHGISRGIAWVVAIQGPQFTGWCPKHGNATCTQGAEPSMPCSARVIRATIETPDDSVVSANWRCQLCLWHWSLHPPKSLQPEVRHFVEMEHTSTFVQKWCSPKLLMVCLLISCDKSY